MPETTLFPSSNQYGVLPPSNQPSVPQASANFFPADIQGGRTKIGGGFSQFGPLDPNLTSQLFGFLTGQVGEGATPFNLSTLLPSGGQAGAGEMTAPLNELMSAFQQFYLGQGGDTNIPGLGTLQDLSETGLPIDQMPAWEAMVAAQGRNIDQQRAQLREQFAFTGNLEASPFGTAMTDFGTQTALDQNALLAQMTTQALEQARGRQFGAAGTLAGGAEGFAGQLQEFDQQAINRMFDEFIRTRPEYAPLLQLLMGGATTFPPIASKKFGIGGLGAALQGAGTLAGSLADIFKGD